MIPRILEHDLRDLRTALGISLRQAAKLTRYEIVVYGNIERGATEKPLDCFDYVRLVRCFLAPHRRRVRDNRRRWDKKVQRIMEGR